MHQALKLKSHTGLSVFSAFLSQQSINHKITEESGCFVIWVVDLEHKQRVQDYFQQWQQGDLKLTKGLNQYKPNYFSWLTMIPWMRYPMTLLLIAICLLVAMVTALGDFLPFVMHFTFTKIYSSYNGVYFSPLSDMLNHHEYWRLISPIFLHFGILHLVFNLLWLFEIGRRIEAKRHSVHLLMLTCTLGAVSNFFQYQWMDQPHLFGGFSGVIYGFLGYCLMYEKVDKNCSFHLPAPLYVFMLVWLALGYTGIFSVIGLGEMANTAHLSGLITGLLIGALTGFSFRNRRNNSA